LDTKDVFMKFEVVRHNRVIYASPDFDAGSFYSLAMREYWDYQPYLEVQRKAYKQRILHDGASGSYS